MRATAIAITAYMVGLLVFYVWGLFSTGWYEVYYLWDKGKDALVFWAIYILISKKLKWAILPVLIFSIVRFIWQILSSVLKADINNEKAIDYLFIILAMLCSYLALKDIWTWLKSNGRFR